MDTLIDRLFSPVKTNDTSLIRKFSGSNIFTRNYSSLFQNIPNEFQQELLKNSLFSADFDFNSSPKVPLLNLHSIFRTIQPGLSHFIPKVSSSPTLMQEYMQMFSNPLNMVDPLNMVGDMNPNLNHLWETSLQKAMVKTDKSDPKGLLSDHIMVSLNSSVTVSKPQINIDSKKCDKPKPVSKKVDCNINQQLADRKTKEIKKRSRKRRQRQRKATSNPTISFNINQKGKIKSDTAENYTNTANSAEISQISSNRPKNKDSDIICDVSISQDSSFVQITLPEISSFVMSVESCSEEDSDWDTASNADFVVDDSEFQVCGLFVTSFTATNMYINAATASVKETSCDKEQHILQEKLKEVNRFWNESYESFELKPKSTAMVSFASGDELVKIFPVEMYERKGEWEIYATERLRFKKRIHEMEEILSPCLSPDHRAKIYQNLHLTIL